jgi:hypothetical protein
MEGRWFKPGSDKGRAFFVVTAELANRCRLEESLLLRPPKAKAQAAPGRYRKSSLKRDLSP